MAQCIASRTVLFLIVATFVHLVVITSLAEQDREIIHRDRRSYENHRGKHRGNNLSGGSEIFTTENSTIVIAQIGGTATLPCGVKKFNNGVVSWIRRRDYQLLTVGLTTYSSDERFLVEHARHLQNWGLQIKFVTPKDAGMYECQVSTHPPISIFIELKVIEATAEILGAPDLYIKSGSSLRIVCSLRQSTEAPVFVFWYHDDRMINYDKDRVIVNNDKSISVLHIAEADKTDSGNYSCVPSNAKPASVNVHVLNGEKPAAMQHGGRNSSPSPIAQSLSWGSVLPLILQQTFALDDPVAPKAAAEVATVPKVTCKNEIPKDENGNNLDKCSAKKSVKYFGGVLQFQRKVVWHNVLAFVILHLMAAYGLLLMGLHLLSLKTIPLFLYNVAWIIIIGLGVTAGAHRLFSHKAYKAKFPLKLFLIVVHTLAGQNCMYVWVRDHRAHHKFTDTDADPHNANRGFFFSHCGWLMMKKHPDVIEKGKTIDMSDLENDSLIMFQKRHYYKLYFLLQAAVLMFPYYGLGYSAWDIFFTYMGRYGFTLNCTWSVNSVAHLYGTKPFDKNIMPVENRGVSFFTNGEGWHNYHHVFPWDYKASEFGASNNLTRKCIEFCSRIGLAYDLRAASKEMVSQRVARTGDPSYFGTSEMKPENESETKSD